MYKNLKEKLLVKEKWIRGILMLFFFLVKYITSTLISITAIFQFIANLVFEKPNERVLSFSKHLNAYLLQIVNFLTFNSEFKPFPFNNFPEN